MVQSFCIGSRYYLEQCKQNFFISMLNKIYLFINHDEVLCYSDRSGHNVAESR